VSPQQLAVVERRIEEWLGRTAAENPAVDAVEPSDGEEIRWFVRLLGEEKDVWTLWLTLRERTLRFETYLMPAPEENEAEFYAQLLRRNRELTGMALEVGEEDAVFLAGSLPVTAVDDDALDWIVGAMWSYVERVFRPALRIGFASRMK